MKRLTISLMLLLPAIAFAQERVYIRDENFDDDIFIVNQGTVENPSLEVCFQLTGSSSDTLFLVVPEASIEDMNLYFRALADRYTEWSRIARKNKVQDFEKPFDIACPDILFRWTQHVNSYSYWEWKEIKTYQSELGPYFKPVFSFRNNNNVRIVGNFTFIDDPYYEEKVKFFGLGKYDEISFEDDLRVSEAIERGEFTPKSEPRMDEQMFFDFYILDLRDIRRFISVLDRKAINRTYDRKRNKRTQADIEALFE